MDTKYTCGMFCNCYLQGRLIFFLRERKLKPSKNVIMATQLNKKNKIKPYILLRLSDMSINGSVIYAGNEWSLVL